MKFKLNDKPVTIYSKPWEPLEAYEVLYPRDNLVIALFCDPNMAGDYVDFLNDKYCDKEINQEWPPIDKEERIRYHLEQIELLKSDKPLRWNRHGNEVIE